MTKIFASWGVLIMLVMGYGFLPELFVESTRELLFVGIAVALLWAAGLAVMIEVAIAAWKGKI